MAKVGKFARQLWLQIWLRRRGDRVRITSGKYAGHLPYNRYSNQLGMAGHGGQMTLANRRVQVARPVFENSLTIGIVGLALPALRTVIAGRYYLVPDDEDDLVRVEGLLFSEEELETIP